jgi:POT family proton-dependent oligopeptide transporter
MSEKLEQVSIQQTTETISEKRQVNTEAEIYDHQAEVQHAEPTDEDWKTLREVADTIPKSAYLVILIEFCERFTYYGLTGPFQNYIQNPASDSFPADHPGAM